MINSDTLSEIRSLVSHEDAVLLIPSLDRYQTICLGCGTKAEWKTERVGGESTLAVRCFACPSNPHPPYKIDFDPER